MTVQITEEEYKEATTNMMGWCTKCNEFTRDMTEPDATDYDCPECGENAVEGAEEALMAERFTFPDVE